MLSMFENKKGLAVGGILGILFGVAAFWILIKWLIVASIIGTGSLFASPLLLLVVALFVILWIKK